MSEPKPNSGPLYPYCLTCKERSPVSHSDGDEAGIEAFLAQHPSPQHEVEPKWQSELSGESNE